MSSPLPSRNGQPSSLDSPSRQLWSEWTQQKDSPSRQLWEELTRWKLQVAQHQKQLELAAAEKATEHRQALAIAAAEHHKVYLSAVETQQLERLCRQNLERQRLLAEREARAREEAKQAELSRLEAERAYQEQQRQEERKREAQRREEQRLQEQKLQEQRLEEERRREAQRREEETKQKQDEAQPPQVNGVVHAPQPRIPSPPTSSVDAGALISPLAEKERVHKKYLDLHQRLKALRKRKDVIDPVKERQWKFDLTKRVGQISADKRANMAPNGPTPHIVSILRQAIQISQPSVDVREYIINPTTPWPADTNFRVSAIFVYLINIFVKRCMANFAEVSNSTYNTAEVVGIVVSHILSDPQLQFHGNTFVDILLAKYHKACPVLWGIYGPDNTLQGRARLGWRDFDSPQEHYSRMTGLGAGWAALTLRDYSRVKTAAKKNPLPAWRYWAALACVLNVPPRERTETHYAVLKGLIAQYVPDFVRFYGQAACVVLRKALGEYVEAGPRNPGGQVLKVLRETIGGKYGLKLFEEEG